MSTAYQFFTSDVRKQRKQLSTLESYDTNQLEPIPENREKHLLIMMPMIINIARTTFQRYTKRIELEDCVQAGMIGALHAIDVYYERAKVKPHVAKLSTFAFHHIKKHVNEYCWKNNTLLSAETTKWKAATSKFVKSGDESYSSEDDTKLFDKISDTYYVRSEDDIVETNHLQKQLFSCITELERKVIFMRNGIDCDNVIEYREIAKRLGYSVGKIHATEYQALEKLRKHVSETPELIKLMSILQNNKSLCNWKL